MHFISLFLHIGMTVFEAKRLLDIFKRSQTSEKTTTPETGHQTRRILKLDKSMGWIPDANTDMGKFYNNVYK